jgi:VIT1/CCC1 family predicted Fe2+/Mn2+ transporter
MPEIDDLKPRPDPTELTTNLLTREITGLKKLVFMRIDGISANMTERFSSVGVQFNELEKRAIQTKVDSKLAVDAALEAAKEAVREQNNSNTIAINKSEATTVKSIEAINLLIQTNGKAFDDKFSDVKERLNRMEGSGAGLKQGWGYLIGALGVLLALAAYFKH